MATSGSSSNSRLVAVGAVVLLLGVILVLLILRGSVGGDDPAPQEPLASEETEEGEDAPADPEPSELVGEGEGSTARVPLPLEVEDGFEAVTVRVSHVRGVAALPQAGDRVVLYQLASEPEDDEDDTFQPAPGDDAERVLDDVEVLGVIGPRPASNDGTLTFVVAVEEADVPGVLPLARDREIWFTLRPGDEDPEDEDEAAEDEA